MTEEKREDHRQNLLLVIAQRQVLLLNRLSKAEHIQGHRILTIHSLNQRLKKFGTDSISLWFTKLFVATFRMERRANKAHVFETPSTGDTVTGSTLLLIFHPFPNFTHSVFACFPFPIF